MRFIIAILFLNLFSCEPDKKSLQSHQNIHPFNKWYELSSKEGRFEILFPSKPIFESEKQETIHFGKIDVKVYFLAFRNGSDINITYGISYRDFGGNLSQEKLNLLYEDASKLTLKTPSAKIISKKNILQDDFSGIEIVYEIVDHDAIKIDRYFFINNISYFLSITTYSKNYPNSSINTFFESFKVDNSK